MVEAAREGSAVLTQPEISQNEQHDDYDPNDVEDVVHGVPPLFDHAPTGHSQKLTLSLADPISPASGPYLGPSRLSGAAVVRPEALRWSANDDQKPSCTSKSASFIAFTNSLRGL
jgi:hypothetical protein